MTDNLTPAQVSKLKDYAIQGIKIGYGTNDLDPEKVRELVNKHIQLTHPNPFTIPPENVLVYDSPFQALEKHCRDILDAHGSLE